MMTSDFSRCQAPWTRSTDGRCPRQIPVQAREGTRYCSAKCRKRAARIKRRPGGPGAVVLAQIQAARTRAEQPLLLPSPVLQALVHLEAAQLLYDEAVAASPPDGLLEPRIYVSRLRRKQLAGNAPALPVPSTFVAVEAVQLSQDQFLVVTALV